MKTMVLKWDSTTGRYYTKSKPNNKTKIYTNDGRANVYKPSAPYIKYLQNLLTKRLTDKSVDKLIFSNLNDQTVSHPVINALLSINNFTDQTKFNKL